MKKSTIALLRIAALAAAAAAGFLARGVYDRQKRIYADFRNAMSDYHEDEMAVFCQYYGIDDPGEYFKVEKTLKL